MKLFGTVHHQLDFHIKLLEDLAKHEKIQIRTQESQNGGPLLPLTRVAERTAAALGVSRRTITRILKASNEAALTKSADSLCNSSEDEYLTPVKQSKVSAAHRDTANNRAALNTVTENKSSSVIYESAKTDYKRHAFFAVEHSETGTINRKQLIKTESQKSVKSKTSDPLSASGSEINIGLLNAHTNTKHHTNEPILQENKMPAVNPNTTSDSFLNMCDSIDLDVLNVLIDPAILETQNTVSTDQLITIKQEKQLEKISSESYVDKEEIDCFTTAKLQSQPEDVDKPSSSQPKSPVAQSTQKRLKDVNLGTVQKSIAKADFKIGRLKLGGNADKNKTDESVEDKVHQPMLEENKPSTSNTINLEAIRKHVKEYHMQNRVPTIRTLLRSLNEAGLFSGSRDTLIKIMADFGFKINLKVKKSL